MEEHVKVLSQRTVLGGHLLIMLKKGEEIRKLKLVGFAFLVTIIAIVLVVISWVPSLSLIGKEEITIKIGEKYSESGCSAIFMNQDVSDKVKIEGNVDENKVGEYDVKYTIKNLMGTDENILTRKIIVYDDIKPTIELVEDDVLVKVGEEYIEPGYNATDNYDGDITDRVVVQSNIDNTKDGEYEVTYLVKDSSSNSATAKRKVIVYEHNAESIPILSYHNFMTYEEKLKYAPYEKYTMSTEMFEQQLQYLKENGNAPVIK